MVFATIYQFGSIVGRQFYYPVAIQFAKMDTVRMFPNQWVRSCLAFNTLSGSVQWVARGELVDNSTFSEITNNAPTDLSGKLILGSLYFTIGAYWKQLSNKLTKFTKGDGCGDDGDYLSWDEMVWNLYGE